MTYDLSWLVFLSSILLLGLKAWNFLDTWFDWRFARQHATKLTPKGTAATKGMLYFATLTLLTGLLLFSLATIMLLNRFETDHPMAVSLAYGRAILLGVIWLEIAKVISLRWTRIAVEHAPRA